MPSSLLFLLTLVWFSVCCETCTLFDADALRPTKPLIVVFLFLFNLAATTTTPSHLITASIHCTIYFKELCCMHGHGTVNGRGLSPIPLFRYFVLVVQYCYICSPITRKVP